MIRRDDPNADSYEPHVVQPASIVSHSKRGDNVVDLLKELTSQGSHLAEQHLKLKCALQINLQRN